MDSKMGKDEIGFWNKLIQSKYFELVGLICLIIMIIS